MPTEIKDINLNVQLNHNIFRRVQVKLGLGKYSKRFKKAQYWLDNQIFQDMKPYMPIDKGMLINLTQAENSALAGSGKVCVYTGVYGRFLYEGKVMVDPETGSPFARPGAKKVVVPDWDMEYSNPIATPHWFDTAKQNHGKEWLEGVKDIMNGR